MSKHGPHISYQSPKKISATMDSMAGHDEFVLPRCFCLGPPIDHAKCAGPLHVGGPREICRNFLRNWEGDDLPRVFGRAN